MAYLIFNLKWQGLLKMKKSFNNDDLKKNLFTIPDHSLGLLLKPLDEWNPFCDKLYITARMDFTVAGRITATIDHECPLVALDSRYRPDSRTDILLLKDVTEGKHSSLSLISGGVFVSLLYPDERRFLLTMRRDANAPAAPLCITEPAGRMDRPLDDVCINEANEELIAAISQDLSGVNRIDLLIFKGSSSKENWMKTKMSQFQLRFPEFCQDNFRIAYRDQFLDEGVPAWAFLPETRLIVKTPYFESSLQGYAWFDKMHHTLEFRRFAEISLQSSESFFFQDGETFNRDPVLIPIKKENPWQDLQKHGPMTSILQHISVS